MNEMTKLEAEFDQGFELSASKSTALPDELYQKQDSPVGQILRNHGLSLLLECPDFTMALGTDRKEEFLPPLLSFTRSRDCRKFLKSPSILKLAELYFGSKVNVHGDFEYLVKCLDRINIETDRRETVFESVSSWIGLALRRLIPAASRPFGSLDHYSESAQAYSLFLDNHMQYTCGYYRTGNETLEEAQKQKFQLIRERCGDIRGKNHLDVGCGWGGLVSYFESNYGSNSVGLTNTPSQATWANNNFGIETFVGDYTRLTTINETYDIITVVGMIEHLKQFELEELLKILHSKLSREGRIYVQFIGRPPNWIGGNAYRIVQKWVFPGHRLITLNEFTETIDKLGLEYSHEPMEHSSHYGLTTRDWAKNFQCNSGKLETILGVRNSRIFLAYLFMSSQMFASGQGKLYRTFLKKRDLTMISDQEGKEV